MSLTSIRRASDGGSGSRVYVRRTLKLGRCPTTVHIPSAAFDLSTVTAQSAAGEAPLTGLLAVAEGLVSNSFHSGPGLEKPDEIVVRSTQPNHA
eukprot:COSAG02_NODE_6199_length_3735_cov_2.553630_3_plen_94_part_00